jgi:hypothetical protein
MNKIFFALLVALNIGTAMAEETLYLGARGFAPLSQQFSLSSLSIGGQVGANFGLLGLRGSVETTTAFQNLRIGGDAYLNLGRDLSKVYLGAGGTVALGGAIDPEAHGLAGLETRLGGMGLFVEALPSFNLGGTQAVFEFKMSAGLNIHF